QVYRQLTINPIFGSGGCHFPPKSDSDPVPELLLNNSNYNGLRHKATAPVSDAVKVAGNWETELPQLGSTEVWDLISLSADAPPLQLHLMHFQVIKRIPSDLVAYGAAYDAAFPDGHCVVGYGPPKAYNTPNGAGALGGNPDVTKFFRSPEPQSD